MSFCMTSIKLETSTYTTIFFFSFRWTIDVGWTSTWVRIVNEWLAVCVYSKYKDLSDNLNAFILKIYTPRLGDSFVMFCL